MRLTLSAALTAILLLACVGGCSESTELRGTPLPNSIPETRITGHPVPLEASFAVDLKWVGYDADGEIKGYEWKVSNNGSDGGQLAAMHADVCRRYDTVPENSVVDGGFSTNEDITAVEQSGSQVNAPMTHEDRIRKRGGDPHARRARDSDEMFAFRQRDGNGRGKRDSAATTVDR